MEIISLPLQLNRYIKQRYRDGTSMGYVVNRNPFELNQYGVHLDLLDKKGKVYQKKLRFTSIKISVYRNPLKQMGGVID